MSGVRTGTRLQQMIELRSRLDHEIAAVLPIGQPLSITVADLPAKTLVMLAIKAPA